MQPGPVLDRQQRSGKIARRCQRERVDDTLESLIQDDDDADIITPDALAAADRSGLVDEENLELFVLWHAWGGMERGVSLTEIADLAGRPGSAALVKDFTYLSGRLGKLRKRQAFFKGQGNAHV